MLRRFRPLVLLMLLVAAVAVGGAAKALPPQASQTAVEHTSHGPDSLALDPRGAAAAGYTVDAYASWATCQYDGVALASDGADLPAYQSANLPQVHAIYVYPAKTTSRFSKFAAMFQADARQSSALLRTLGRDVRWDQRALPATVTVCDGSRTVLDITVFQSKYVAKQLATDRQFTLVADELAASGRFSSTNKKYVAWLDAGSRYCGQGSLWQDTARSASNRSNVNRTTGIVYRPYTTSDALTGGFCRGRTLLHELGHNLGAVQNVAPNAFDGAHCDDDNNDTMCYTGQAADQVTSPQPQFDYGKNDYWDPGASLITATNSDGYPLEAGERLPWWTLNLSRYVCPLGSSGGADCVRPNSVPGY